MEPMRQFEVRWSYGNKVEAYRMPAASASDARRAFEMVKVPGVRILSVDQIDDPGDSAAPVPVSPTQPPQSPGTHAHPDEHTTA
jgi:hypothetical protein